MKKKYTLLWVIALILIIILAFVLKITKNPTIVTSVFDFNQCVWAGYPIMESYPAQCKTPDGKSFTQDIGNELEKTNLITIENPRPNQKIGSPITITGKARGNWYFEASFPVELLDDNGNQLAIAPAQAQGDWMTTDFVPYSVTLTFPIPATPTGKLILHKDNPSGLPQNDDQLIVPVVFY